MNFTQELKNKRKELKETQAIFGKRFEVSHASVSDWEAGKTDIPIRVIEFVHTCTKSSSWVDGYGKGIQKAMSDNARYFQIGQAIADLVSAMTKKEDY